METNKYPLPTPDQIFVKFANKNMFTIIDHYDTLIQVEIDNEAKKMHAFIGLFQMDASEEEFQAIDDKMLSGFSASGFAEFDVDHKMPLAK